MKKYRLLKDLPTFKAGQMFVLLAENEKKEYHLKTFGVTIYKQPGLYMINDNGEAEVLAYHQTTLIKFPNVLDDWFEEIEENRVWKPEYAEGYWHVCEDGTVDHCMFSEDELDEGMLAIGNCFKTKDEAEKAVEKLKALRRLRERGLKFIDWEWEFPTIDSLTIKAQCGCSTEAANQIREDLTTLFCDSKGRDDKGGKKEEEEDA